MIFRGDVVLVDFPFSDGGGKIRPALVIQNDRDNRSIRKTVVAMITGNLRRKGDPSHLLVDPTGAATGLHGLSLVSCINLYTIVQSSVIRTIGQLSSEAMNDLDLCLKAALGLA